MLPDFPTIKKELDECIQLFMRLRIKAHMPGMQGVKQTRIFEGGGGAIVRSTGQKDTMDMRCSEAEFEVKYKDVPNLTLRDIFDKVEDAARDMAEQTERNMYEILSNELDKAGQTVNAGGKKMSVALFLEVLDGMLIPFDENGQPQLPQIHIHPDAQEKLVAILKQLEEDPESKVQYDELIARKRSEWRAEQASRKLVG